MAEEILKNNTSKNLDVKKVDSNRKPDKDSKEEKKSSFVKWSSLFLFLVFAISMSIGAIVGATTRPDDDFILFYIDGEVYDDPIEPLLSSNKEEPDTGDGTQSQAEQDANKIISLFLSTALSGDPDYETVDEGYTYILNTNKEHDWNNPYILLNDSDAYEVDPILLRDYFIQIKFFSDTLNESIYSYLLDYGENSLEIMGIIDRLEKAFPDNYESISFTQFYNEVPSSDPDLYNDTITALSNNPDYRQTILADMYVYTYLWQDSSYYLYDYIFTQEIVYSKPSMVASAQFDVEETEGLVSTNEWAQDYEELKNMTIGDQISALDWNNYYDDMHEAGVLVNEADYESKLSDDTFNGFKGISFGTSIGDQISSDWLDIDKTWQVENEYNEINGPAITESNIYSHDNILTTGNFYIANEYQGGASGEGAVISTPEGGEDPSDFTDDYGTANIYVYSQMYPYTFSEHYGNELNSQYKPNEYSLFANTQDMDGTTVYTKASLEDKLNDETNGVNYIFDEWFGPDNSLFGEIYLANELFNFNSTLQQEAMDYWNDNGFYIELSGSYYDDYAQYIPDGLLKK